MLMSGMLREKPFEKKALDFPGGPVVKNLTAIAGDMGLIPGLGRSHIPTGQLKSPCAPTSEAVLRNKRRHRSKKPMHHS